MQTCIKMSSDIDSHVCVLFLTKLNAFCFVDVLDMLFFHVCTCVFCTQSGKSAFDHAQQNGKHDVAKLIEVRYREKYVLMSSTSAYTN